MYNFNDFIENNLNSISENKLISRENPLNFDCEDDIKEFVSKIIVSTNEFDYELLRILLLSLVYYVFSCRNENEVINFYSILDIIEQNIKYTREVPEACFYAELLKVFPESHPAYESFSIINELPNEEINNYFKKLKDLIENITE